MKVTITPKTLAGTIVPPPSKSQAHRFIIAAALSDGVSRIQNINLSKDMEATLRCIQALGASYFYQNQELTITGIGGKRPFHSRVNASLPFFDCGESGSTLRFFIPIALAVCGGGIFTGQGRLMQRPQKPYFDLFDDKGIFWEQKDTLLTVRGRLKAGEFALPGDVSSQFFTGLLFALTCLEEESTLICTTPLESENYVDLTIQVQQEAGVFIQKKSFRFYCPKNAVYHAFTATVEPDWSQAAFWYAAQALGSNITVQKMNQNSVQGDKIFLSFIQQLKVPGKIELDVTNCPDLVPPLAVVSALRQTGETTQITGAGRLRIKESDRLKAVHDILEKMGVAITEHPDALTIQGISSLSGDCILHSFNDHRIAMMAAIAATKADAPIVITGAECVSKSYPDFWDQYIMLGGEILKEED